MQQPSKISDTQNDSVSSENSDNVLFDIQFIASDFASKMSEDELAMLELIMPELLLDYDASDEF